MKRTLIFTTFILSMVVLTSCSKGSAYNNTQGNNNGGTPPPANSNSVTISAMSFSPADLTVKAGTTVTWTNNDNISHTVTADDNSFDSGTMGHGATFTHTFATAGSYTYHCAFHSSMTAKVTVN